MQTQPLKAFYDVVVVGGGPAGAATAHYLARDGHRVAVVERSAYESWRAGETLPPQAQLELSRLGILNRFLDENFASSVEMRWSWGEPALREHNFMTNPYGSPCHVDRQRFDTMLLRRAQESGADAALAATVSAVVQTAEGWNLVITKGNEQVAVSCTVLVDATGHASTVARALGVRRIRLDQLIGVVGIFRVEQAPAPILLVEAVDNGWWYCVPLSGSRLLTGLITDSDLVSEGGSDRRAWWTEELKRSVHTSQRLASPMLEDGLHLRTAATATLAEPCGERWLAVGDAASSCDPISGAGVTKALHFAWKASEAITMTLKGNPNALAAYGSAIKADFASYRKQLRAHYGKERRWPTSPFWQRRHLETVTPESTIGPSSTPLP